MTLIRRLLTVAFAASLATTAVAQDGKVQIATVDMQELFKQYFKTSVAQKDINIEKMRIQKDNDERSAKIREIEESLTKIKKQFDDPSFNDSKKQSLAKEAQGLSQDGTALDRDRREFLDRRNRALQEKMVMTRRAILEEIRKLVEEKAKTDNFDYVFDKSGLSSTQVPVLIYSKDNTDITATLLKTLNKDAPADFVPGEADAKLDTPDIATPPVEKKDN